jgi:phytoene dehydrogenase-like protein
MAVVSPFLRTLPLHQHGLEWIYPTYPLAHPFDGGTAAILDHSIENTCQALGVDGHGYRRLVGPLAAKWSFLEEYILGPIRIPRHPFLMARFGINAIQPASRLAR